MTWAMFYLICFLIGMSLSVLACIGGSFHLLHLHLHLPHGSGLPTHPGMAPSVLNRAGMPHINFATVTAFLTWFGAAGYLLTLYSTFVVAIVLSFSILSGGIGATIIFWFVVKFLLAHERELDPADYNRIGVLARVTSPIGAGGTGEITFSQAGSRNTCGARNETGETLARGAEVVIIRYEHGIAYVRPWDELAKGTDFAADTAAHEVALKLKS